MLFLKKKISKIMLLAGIMMLPALLFTSCSDELELPAPEGSGPRPGFISVSLRNRISGTRATEEDVDALNENLITTAWVCLYVDGATDDTEPVLAREFDISRNTTGTVEIRLNHETLDALFPGGATRCKAYVVANLPENAIMPADKTVANLQNIAISADFASSEPQPSFVMDGSTDLTLAGDRSNPAQCTVSGQADLQRAASKIRLGVKIPQSVTDNGEEWSPDTGRMSVLITDGVRKASVTPLPRPLDNTDPWFSTTTDAAVDSHRGRLLNDKGEAEAYRYQLDQPFYTFPNTWSGDDDHMTYMVLTVPFKKKDAESYRTCYYTVPVVRDNAIARNVSYMVNINVNILGSFNPDEPLLLEDLSYRAIEWSRENIDVAIQDYRYLVLDQTEYVLNNIAGINIPFYSSHETVITDVSFKYYLYNTNAAGLTREVTISPEVNARSTPDSVYNVWVNNTINAQTNARTVSFVHELKEMTAYNSNGRVLQLSGQGTTYPDESSITSNINDIYRYAMTDADAFSRFEIEMTIVHKDLADEPDTPFKRTIRITQYPAMYIETDPNNYTLDAYTQSFWGYSRDDEPYGPASYGNVYINSSQSGGGNMSPSGLTGGNRNPNMYIINVTRLSNERYRIGDPRIVSTDNLDYNSWASSPALFSPSPRQLMYYYPADRSEAMKMTIAPKFRVASSYGVSPEMNKQTAERRCASYQEKDRPAGRWRLPTYAEMEFIINLSNNNKIPILFSSDSRYWNAQGSSRGVVTDGVLDTPTQENAHVRCVYDEWYWESITPKLESDGTEECRIITGVTGSQWNQTPTYTDFPYTHYPFTWGDMPR